jgi:hypothetical protein
VITISGFFILAMMLKPTEKVYHPIGGLGGEAHLRFPICAPRKSVAECRAKPVRECSVPFLIFFQKPVAP